MLTNYTSICKGQNKWEQDSVSEAVDMCGIVHACKSMRARAHRELEQLNVAELD
jgi:hypothetical protein